uniref:RGS domain-containing protein n=1 Tax=Mesocestoides corti TaxID=53468 RepID=A0A5K3FX25_MESCO
MEKDKLNQVRQVMDYFLIHDANREPIVVNIKSFFQLEDAIFLKFKSPVDAQQINRTGYLKFQE